MGTRVLEPLSTWPCVYSGVLPIILWTVDGMDGWVQMEGRLGRNDGETKGHTVLVWGGGGWGYLVKVVEGCPELLHLLLADTLGISGEDLVLHLVDGSGNGGEQLLPAHTDVLREEEGVTGWTGGWGVLYISSADRGHSSSANYVPHLLHPQTSKGREAWDMDI